MTGRLVRVPTFLTAYLAVTKYAVALALLALPAIAQATPTGFGKFEIDRPNLSNKTTKGTYTTDTGAKGTFKITRDNYQGYDGVTFKDGNNGIEILHHSDTNQDGDEFGYNLEITPDDKDLIHTIKIGQASYGATGNSNDEHSNIARLRLKYNDKQVDTPMKATIRDNPDVCRSNPTYPYQHDVYR